MFPNLRAGLRQLRVMQVSTHAASTSFFIILSVFPLALLLVTLLQFLPLTYADLMELVSFVVPESLVPVVDYILYETFRSNATALISLTGVVALWSASRGVLGIITGLNAIFGDSENRSYLYRRGTAIVYTFALLIALILTLVLQVFGEGVADFLVDSHIIGKELLAALELRYVFTVGILAMIFMLMFAVFPARRIHIRHAIPAGLFSAAGWVLFSALFSLYVNHGGGSMFYGSLVLVMMTMLWLYSCMLILFYGGVLCRICAEGQCTWANFVKILQIWEKTK